MNAYNKENVVETREILGWGFLALLALLMFVLFLVGCNGQSVKPSNELETAVKASMENQQEMREEIDTLNGDLIKYQQSFAEFKTTIMTTINQRFETLQGSTKTGDVEGGVKTSHDTNSIWYGIGLVVVVLIFALIVIWGAARMLKAAVAKIL